VPAGTLLSTLIAFICVYALFMAAFLVFTGAPDRARTG
jgi:cytochrome d ubiquinol oxidase subunit I